MKRQIELLKKFHCDVARRVRAWIETFKFLDRLLVGHVARRVRAWIETFLFCSTLLIICVARRVRAWIETI